MKKIMLFLMAVLLSAFLFAQDRKMTELKTNQLPKSVTDFISKNFPGGNITRAGKIEEKAIVSYAATVENKGTKHTYIFDTEGKLIGKGDQLLKEKGETPGATKVTAPASTPAGTGDQKKQAKPIVKPSGKSQESKPKP